MLENLALLLNSIPLQVSWVGVFRAAWLAPLILTGVTMLSMQGSYLQAYRNDCDRHLPLSLAEVLACWLRGEVPSRQQWRQIDWSGWAEFLALFNPGVSPQLHARRQRIWALAIAACLWMTVPAIASIWMSANPF